ncbi:hypothetical protein AVEN_1358-1 [Araneus ventricosus]|uniref:Mos1 transposase HTH domain-containing protein n=1 Tax=Araneus ventricosus TaxID=182803 RepID=A0A4Y2D2N6_ARAVE|nr:hypothetical protein AVEN_1358-1 [Araneus ventricosus]
MSRVNGKNFMSDGVVHKWGRKFKDRRTDLHDEERQGRKSIATENFVQRVPGSFWSSWNLEIQDVSDQPVYSPDLAMSNFHLFLELKSWLRGQRFQKNELQSNVKAHFTSLA